MAQISQLRGFFVDLRVLCVSKLRVAEVLSMNIGRGRGQSPFARSAKARAMTSRWISEVPS